MHLLCNYTKSFRCTGLLTCLSLCLSTIGGVAVARGVWYGCVTLRRTGVALVVLPTHVVSPVSGGRPICGSILGTACGAVVCRVCLLLRLKTEP